jgi:SecD/SecF fusion protein
MQGKGIVRFFLVVMTLVCVVQYLLILPTQKVEKAAEQYAQQVAQSVPEEEQQEAEKEARVAFLDSMSSEVILSVPLLKKYTYQDLKSSQLALGLDLKGGMSVVLQVDLREFIRALANNTKDPTFDEALARASEKLKETQRDYVSLFAESWREVSDQPLSSLFRKSEQLEDVTANTSDGEMTRILREAANETVNRTYSLLKKRIDKLGVTQPNISLDETRDLILVELPGIDNPERARNIMQSTAKMEFWETFRITDNNILTSFQQANERLRSSENQQDSVDNEPQVTINPVYAIDTLGNIDSSQIVRYDTIETAPTDLFAQQQGPLFDIFEVNSQGLYSLAVMGTADRNQKDEVEAFLKRPNIRSLFPKDGEFLWKRDANKDFETGEATDRYELYLIKKQRNSNKAPLEGDKVVQASAQPDPQTGEMTVSLRMNQDGGRTWGQMTQKAANNGNREIAIVLDGEIASAPRVINPILNGSSSITGSFTAQEANDLASILQIGKLPASPRIIQESLVGPTLGAKNIQRSVSALVIGFSLVLVFMILYYGTGGIVSIISLFLNLFFIFGTLASIGTVLTLPGIAGIVLTIGMAVDANVIIFERIREELREGKSLLMSIQDGFANSYSAIIDANVTTILTAIVLAYFGLGPIKGFAIVLIIGVLSSLFTAVLVCRLIIDWWTKKRGNDLSFWTGMSKNAFAHLKIDWLSKRRVAYTISGIIILLGFGSFFMRGFDLGVDFKGGYSYNVEFITDKDVEADELRDALTATFGETPIVKAVDVQNTYNVVTDFNVDNDDENAAEEVLQKLHEGVQTIVGSTLALEDFRQTDATGVTHITSSNKVGPTIADDIKNSSYYAATFALLLIFFYIFVRFSKWQYSLGAVAALFHDVMIVLSMFSLLHGILPFPMEIDQAFIAALLTVIGYSINDTVVVFDRIREFLGLYTGKSKKEVINMAVNSTVSRTVITSLTTLFVVLILFLFGGGSIKGFAFALVIGILVGTYSSIFIATPIMSDFSAELKPKDVKKTKGFSKAASKAR